jgi:hypothetical protein
MSQYWDEFSKSLAEPLPRRESLRRLGIAVTTTILGPLGPQFAWAGRRAKQQDPCKAFCQCRNKRQQDQCLKACKACNQNTSRLAGSCGNYVCCASGQTACGGYCTDLAFDPDNCGACGHVCAEPGPYELGMCMFGECEYACVEGAVHCDGACTFLEWDPDNCGACGNVCPGSAPICNWGECAACPSGQSLCDGQCVDIMSDPSNCGACGTACPSSAPYCRAGVCAEQLCLPWQTWCGHYCADLSTDPFNCGACHNQCAQSDVCAGGSCQPSGGDGGWSY